MKTRSGDHLTKRRGVYYFKATVAGKRFCQSLGTTDVRTARTKAKDMYEAADRGVWNQVACVLRPKSAKGAVLGDVTKAYADIAGVMQRPSPVVVRYAVNALERVAAEVNGRDRHNVDDLGLAQALNEKAQDDYTRAMLTRDGDSDSTRISICSTLRTAKQVISRDMSSRIARQVAGMPDPSVLDAWRRYRPIRQPDTEEKEFTFDECTILKTAGEKIDRADTDDGKKHRMWLAWALGYYAALRAGETEAAKWSWFVKHVPTPVERLACKWLEGRDYVWILKVQGTKTRASTADIPLHDTVVERFLEHRGADADSDYLLGIGVTDRENVIRDLSAYFRGKGWEKTKTTHCLRAYRLQVWFNTRGVEARYRWGRHALRGMDRNYLASRYLGAEPLPADQ